MSAPSVNESDRLGASRWRGQPGRVEVWYATFTDGAGTGYWIHHELVAPSTGQPAFGHGWAAVFPEDEAPILERFRSDSVSVGDPQCWFGAGDVRIGKDAMVGATDDIRWDLGFTDPGPPLYTFPKGVWEREVLPAAQIVPWPQARISGSMTVGGSSRRIDAVGAVARIYGHGNAQRWCWLHAAIDHDTVFEAVCAVARRPGLRALPPLAMVRLRRTGHDDWPPKPVVGALRLRARIDAEGFTISGTVAGSHLRAVVRLPPERCVTLEYQDPDGAAATCTNSERADAEITLVEPSGSHSRWELAGRAHAEIGRRP